MEKIVLVNKKTPWYMRAWKSRYLLFMINDI